MIHPMLRLWTKSIRGNVAVIFALMLLPIAGVVGFAIDASRQVSAKKHISRIADSAALAGARTFKESNSAPLAMRAAHSAIIANRAYLHGDVSCPDANSSVTVMSTVKTVRVSIGCTVPTIFGLNISGLDEMDVSVVAEAKAGITTLEVALLLDLSSSMRGSKAAALKVAATNLIDTLVTPDDRVRISLVPYSSGVNAGIYANPALDRPDDDDTEADGVDRVCVSERGGTEAFTDAAAGTNAWVGEPTHRTEHCPTTPILPLTDDTDYLKQQVDSMYSQGYTLGHVAVAWAWYLLSPEWSSAWPVDSRPRAYGNPDELKVMVMMTDGAFNGANIPSQGTPSQQAEDLCEGMRAKGIIIFSVAFQAEPSGRALMLKCATSPAHYYEATNDSELLAAYAEIASKFKGVALSR